MCARWDNSPSSLKEVAVQHLVTSEAELDALYGKPGMARR